MSEALREARRAGDLSRGTQEKGKGGKEVEQGSEWVGKEGERSVITEEALVGHVFISVLVPLS